MTSFKRTEIIQYAKTEKAVTRDSLYWKELDFPVTVKEFGSINSIDFSPVSPHLFAVCCSTKVQIYDPIAVRMQKSITRFKRAVLCSSFRADGQLIVTGGDDSNVSIFTVENTKSQLRVFKGHQNAVHSCKFLSDKLRVASYSDDRTVRCWDVTTEEELRCFEGHSDYVRSGCVGYSNSDLIVSGSYDHTAMIWDARSPDGSLITVDHGDPVESVLLFPNDSLLITAGGTTVRVWDIIAGGRLLTQMSHHHKTVTSLSLCTQNRRLMSGGLDKHIKIYDLGSYEVVHSLDFPAPILSLGVSPQDQTLVVGMTDGLLSIQKRKATEKPLPRSVTNEISYRYKLNKGVYENTNVVVVPNEKREKEPKYDVYIRRFEHSRALTHVLKNSSYSSKPSIVVSVMRELQRRGALKSAMAGREYDTLAPLIHFLVRHIGSQQFMRHVLDFIDNLLDVYGDTLASQPQNVQRLFRRLAKKLSDETTQMQLMTKTLGAVETVLSMAASAQNRSAAHMGEEEIIGLPIVTDNRRRLETQ